MANTNQGGGYSPARNLKKNMNEELKDEEIILDGQVKESLTYEVYEDNAGGLHMSIFEEDVKTAELLAICYNIKPQDVKACIADLEEYRNWEGIVLRENEEGRDIMEENHALAVSCEIIDETYVAAGLGLRREIYYSNMGAAGKEAYNG